MQVHGTVNIFHFLLFISKSHDLISKQTDSQLNILEAYIHASIEYLNRKLDIVCLKVSGCGLMTVSPSVHQDHSVRGESFLHG